ncbi:MAG: YicC/YloC family endoribonuclease [Bacteroidia bacterium]|nr:YicC family protein [Bacteroidia bacterium]MDW8157804.1 YicC/YloC family endoribonuclease [Bacteroidia bacterium]
MLESMTGFGTATFTEKNYTITVQIKSLNSKTLEFHFKLPPYYFQQEIALKNLITQKIQRGKIYYILSVHKNILLEKEKNYFNHALLKKYYNELLELQREMEITSPIPLTTLLHLPQVIAEPEMEVSEEEWQLVLQATEQALANLLAERLKEGNMLYHDIVLQIRKVETCLAKMSQYEGARIANIKLKLQQALAEIKNSVSYSEERLEQELIYYLEKLDINEEKIRIQSHLHNFYQTLEEPQSQGRKLNFIMQELWREANTLGVKANEVNIQALVVEIKDAVEKIKEQLMNVV